MKSEGRRKASWEEERQARKKKGKLGRGEADWEEEKLGLAERGTEERRAKLKEKKKHWGNNQQ